MRSGRSVTVCDPHPMHSIPARPADEGRRYSRTDLRRPGTLARALTEPAIAVVGYGDADSADPDAQAKALALGLQRAQAMAQALAADGVPQQSVRLEAQAGGRGGSARIIE